MKKVFTDGIFLFYTTIAYLIYIIFSVFMKNDFSDFIIFIFTAPFLYGFFRILILKSFVHKIQLFIFVFFPFIISCILTYYKKENVLLGWEVSVPVLIPVFLSMLFKSDESDSLFFSRNIFLRLYIAYIFAFIVSFIHYIASENFQESAYIFLMASYPSFFIIIVISFFRFIVDVAVAKFSLNSFRPFKYGCNLKRVFFTSDKIFTNSQQVFGGIVLAEGITENYFKENASALDKVLSKSGISIDNMKRKSGVSSKISENKELKMAPLQILIASKCSYINLKMPEILDDGRTYLGLAENSKILGYYIFDKVGAKSSETIVKIFQNQLDVKPYFVGDSSAKSLNIETVPSLCGIDFNSSDMVVAESLSDIKTNNSPITVIWNSLNVSEKADVNMIEPTLLSVVKFIEIIKSSGKKMDKVLFLSYIPLLIPVFASNYKIFLPELSTVAVMLSLLISLFISLYSGGFKK